MALTVQGVNSKVSARLIAEVINEFFQPLTYKTMAFMALMIIGIIILSEVLLRRSINN